MGLTLTCVEVHMSKRRHLSTILVLITQRLGKHTVVENVG